MKIFFYTETLQQASAVLIVFSLLVFCAITLLLEAQTASPCMFCVSSVVFGQFPRTFSPG